MYDSLIFNEATANDLLFSKRSTQLKNRLAAFFNEDLLKYDSQIEVRSSKIVSRSVLCCVSRSTADFNQRIYVIYGAYI